MKLRKIKTDAEALDAVRSPVGERPKVELTFKDGTVVGLRIGQLHATVDSYNVLSVHREATHEEATRFKLTATAKGFPPATRYFEYAHERSAAKATYADGTEFEEADDVAVALADDGTVLRELADQPEQVASKSGDEIPF